MSTSDTSRPRQTRQVADDRPIELAELHLDTFGALGDTFAEFEGETINVFGGIPGETVSARILRYRRKKRPVTSAIVQTVIEPSPHRVEAPCEYFGLCTGCQWQHISYDHQIELKQQRVQQELDAYASLTGMQAHPTLPSENVFNYRNHARFTIRMGSALGFVNRLSRHFVQVDDCMLMDDGINNSLAHLQGKVAETSQLSIRHGVNTNDQLVQPTLQNPEISIPSGQTHYREKMGDRIFRVASPSFFQVNTKQAERMVNLTIDALNLDGTELLVDAYAGVGTFAILAAPRVRKVIAIEESPAAVQDAAMNTIGIENLEYLEGRTEDVLGELERDSYILILDPPRIGCHPQALEAIIQSPPSKLAYVSCDPESLARDLDVLVQGGLAIESIQPIDMFPQTYHVECVAILTHNHHGAT